MSLSPPPTVRVFIAGVSGSGKSVIAWRMYLERFPRRLIIDLTGEWADRAEVIVSDVDGLARALRTLAPRGHWTISAELGIDQIPDLVRYLMPIPNLEQSPIYQCHGAVLLVDEVDLIAPQRSGREEIRTLWRRSRHVGLSIVATTQRPEAVSREVSAQSHQALALHLVEPAALDYMADLMRVELEPALAEWTQAHPHGGLWVELRTGRRYWLTEQGRLVAPRSPVVSAPASVASAPARAGQVAKSAATASTQPRQPETPTQPIETGEQ